MALAAIIAASVLASCGGGDVLDVDGERPGVKRERVAAKAEPRREAGKQVQRVTHKEQPVEQKPARSDAGRLTARSTPPAAATVDTTRPSTTARKADSAPDAVTCADDFPRDMDGSDSAPAYADLGRGCLEEKDTGFNLTGTTVGALPARMPDRDTHLTIGFELKPTSGRTMYVAAEASDRGWSAYLTRGQGRQQLPSPAVNGRQVVLQLPAAALDGASRLRWRVESSWLRSTLVSTSYAFDDAPNGASASFDRS